jgi:hypothetical protein
MNHISDFKKYLAVKFHALFEVEMRIRKRISEQQFKLMGCMVTTLPPEDQPQASHTALSARRRLCISDFSTTKKEVERHGIECAETIERIRDVLRHAQLSIPDRKIRIPNVRTSQFSQARIPLSEWKAPALDAHHDDDTAWSNLDWVYNMDAAIQHLMCYMENMRNALHGYVHAFHEVFVHSEPDASRYQPLQVPGWITPRAPG